MIERQIGIKTRDGEMSTFICHPERSGPHPVIILFMDAPGIREELRDMVRRLATVGYYVVLPNLYYRSKVEELGPFIGEQYAAVREKFIKLKDSLSIAGVMDDTDAIVAFAREDRAAKADVIGCVGYCMSGQYAVNAAVRHPDIVKAAASIYGVSLVTDKPDSPHLAAKRSPAMLYFGCAENDEHVPTSEIEQLKDALKNESRAVIEIYPGTYHGFAFPQRPKYDRQSAERHWERLFDLFATNLCGSAIK